MKKNRFLGVIALAALTMMGCSKDETNVALPQDNAIEFSTYLGRDAQTRGTVFTTDAMKTVGFGVFAYYTDEKEYSDDAVPNFMYNQQVTYNTTAQAWTYTPVKYWPNEKTDYVSFFAYAPYVEGKSLNTKNPVINFTVGKDVTSHVDLVAAEPHKDCQKQLIQDNVKFVFGHALSRVGFKVEAVMDEKTGQNNGDNDQDTQANPIATQTTISVQEVELIGTFNTAGNLNLDGVVWDGLTTEETSYKLESSDFEDIAKNVTTVPTLLNKDSEYMMLIPTTTPTGIRIRVKYTVTTEDTKLAGGKSVVENNITSDAFNFQFEQGKAYTFVLHLGLTSVKLDAEVDNWDDETDHVVNVPNNN